MRRIGVFGGTFDPVHVGHLILAQEAAVLLKLDRLLFIPANRPAHKRAPREPVEHRIAMLRRAIRGRPRFRVSPIEADRGGVSFTVKTLEALHRSFRAELFFLMGQDSLEEFGSWREPGRILDLARLAVIPRGDRTPRVPPSLRRRVILVRAPWIGVSSTELRRRLRLGLPAAYWTPDAVLRYIERHGLYGTGRRSR